MKALNEENFYKRAYIWAKKRGFTCHEAEDFQSWAYLKYKETRRSNLAWLFPDYVRERFGFSTTRKKALINPILFDEKEFAQPLEDLDRTILFEKVTDLLKGPDRAIFKLKFELGYTFVEIAHLWGVSRSRMSQIVREILARADRKLIINQKINKINHQLKSAG